MIADALAIEAETPVTLLFPVDPSAPAQQKETIQEYLNEIVEQFTTPVSTQIIETEDSASSLTKPTRETASVIIGVGEGEIKRALLGRPSDRIVEGVDCTAVVVSAGESRPGRVRRFLEKQVF